MIIYMELNVSAPPLHRLMTVILRKLPSLLNVTIC